MKKHGFTLVEVVVVIFVVSVVSSTAIVSFNKTITIQNYSTIIRNMRTIDSIMDIYQVRHGTDNLPGYSFTTIEDFFTKDGFREYASSAPKGGNGRLGNASSYS